MKRPNVLVVHPAWYTAEVLAAVLQDCGFQALPLTNALDALENVENLYFDLALVSNQLPSVLPELLFQSHRGIWLEIIILKIPKQWRVADIGDFAGFVEIVRESVSDSRMMTCQMEEVWYTAWYGQAAEPRRRSLTEGEWAKFEGLERMFAEGEGEQCEQA